MEHCTHTSLLELASTSPCVLVDTGRFERLVQELPNPEQQQPQLILCLGDHSKHNFLDSVLPAKNAGPRRSKPGLCHMYEEISSREAKCPRFFVDISPSSGLTNSACEPRCHDALSVKVDWATSTRELDDIIVRELLMPLACAVCVFAEDFGGVDKVRGPLALWMRKHTRADVKSDVNATLIIVTRKNEGIDEEIETMLLQLQTCRSFSDVKVGAYTPAQLRRILATELRRNAAARTAAFRAFSARHLSFLFSRRVHHIAQSPEETFSEIVQSRHWTPPTPYLHDGIRRLLKISLQQGLSVDLLASILGTALLMDAYPLSSHLFNPTAVFRELYRSQISRLICEHLAQPRPEMPAVSQEHVTNQILHHFVTGFDTMRVRGSNAASVHYENLQGHNRTSTLSSLNSSVFCACCIIHRSEHVFRCGHSLCDICVQRFGQLGFYREHEYLFRSCVVCGEECLLRVRLKPPTAGIRTITVDGGGARGVVPLKFIGHIQAALGPSCRVQDFFDISFGTSAGGLIVLGLFVKQWDVSNASSIFRDLAKGFFATRTPSLLRRLSNIQQWIRCVLDDSRYNTEKLESILKRDFGSTTRMFDFPSTTISQQKIAVTATSISDASPFLFTNYNGPRGRRRGCGYKHIRPDNLASEPFLWQAARATSAAPVLFKPITIPGLGTFQDGSLRHNNPVKLAIWESRRIWPKDTALDVVLSLGTGTTQDNTTPKAPFFRNLFIDGWMPRLYRSVLNNLDGEVIWQELENILDLDRASGFFRLNIVLPGKELPMDDSTIVDRLCEAVDECKDDPRIIEITMALLASEFYITLVEQPCLGFDGLYHCRAQLRLRGSYDAIITSLQNIGSDLIEVWKDHVPLDSIGRDGDLCHTCGRFRKDLRFTVRHLSETVSFNIHCGGHVGTVSGFPQKMGWFVKQQHLDTPFYAQPNGVCGSCVGCTATQSNARRGIKRRRSNRRDVSTKKRVRNKAALEHMI